MKLIFNIIALTRRTRALSTAVEMPVLSRFGQHPRSALSDQPSAPREHDEKQELKAER
jgi:hypothetical protein